MKELTIAQEYLLLALNKRGRLSTLDLSVPACFFAGCLIELAVADVIDFDKKAVNLKGKLPETLEYLRPLYNVLWQYKKPVKMSRLVDKYIFGLSTKTLTQLVNSVGDVLADEDCAQKILDKKGRARYISNADAIDAVVQKIRNEALAEGDIPDQTAAVMCLLKSSNKLKKYFSKYESGRLRERIKQLKSTDSHQVVKLVVDYVDAVIVVVIAASSIR